MDKKYQVFVSSTYEDLRRERQEVIQSLLESDCIPVGMELFPAGDDELWGFIKDVIAECDYYAVVVAGRYGSMDKDGVSYTEKEYRHALELGKPIMAFLHAEPDKIPNHLCEKEADKREKLLLFQDVIKQKMCRFYKNPEDLGGAVAKSITAMKKRHPAVGWVRADVVYGEGAQEILRLREQLEQLKIELDKAIDEPPEGADGLAGGQDTINVDYIFTGTFMYKKDSFEMGKHGINTISLTYDDIFKSLAPLMVVEAEKEKLRNRLIILVEEQNLNNEIDRAKTLVVGFYKAKGLSIKKDSVSLFTRIIEMKETTIESLLIQFRSLGLIELSERQRSLKDTGTYWKLTKRGDRHLTRLLARKKEV